MENKPDPGHLSRSERDLIRQLYGFGCEKKSYDQLLQEKPGETRQELEQLEMKALRKLRHLKVTELAELRRAG